jgi:choline dehydrogenase
VHAVSPELERPPRILANYLAAAADRAVLLAGLKLARLVAAQAPLRPFLVEETLPGRDVGDDAALLDYASRTGQTSYHPVGTCRMGSDAQAVVDPTLRVQGVRGLRIADASVLPLMPSSNTNAAAIMIGERAADFLLAERRA